MRFVYGGRAGTPSHGVITPAAGILDSYSAVAGLGLINSDSLARRYYAGCGALVLFRTARCLFSNTRCRTWGSRPCAIKKTANAVCLWWARRDSNPGPTD